MSANFNIPQKVLVAPLDWGLGHTTRCIPIIRALLLLGHEVVMAGEGAQHALLQKEFPQLTILPLKGYRVHYSRSKKTLPLVLLRQLPRIWLTIQAERSWLKRTIRTHHITVVLSDNRFGLSAKNIPCFFITHQLGIRAPFPWMQGLIRSMNYHYINRFTACWVPDAAGEPNLGAALSHPPSMPRIPVHYIGLLSRFSPERLAPKYACCFLLSGPEPQRTILETKILESIAHLPGKIVLVRGKPGSNQQLNLPEHITVYTHLETSGLQQILQQSERVICRSGYTSIMELLSLQKKVLVIPTPAQTEQEYLAKRLHELGWCMQVLQDDFNLEQHVQEMDDFQYRQPHLPLFHESQLAWLLAAKPLTL